MRMAGKTRGSAHGYLWWLSGSMTATVMFPLQPGSRQQVKAASRQHLSALLHTMLRPELLEVPESMATESAHRLERRDTAGCGTLLNHTKPYVRVVLVFCFASLSKVQQRG